MAEAISTAAAVITIAAALIQAPLKTIQSLDFFISLYEPAGIVIFGSREVWQMQMQILGSVDDADAMNFKKSIQQESSIIAVAVRRRSPRLLRPY